MLEKKQENNIGRPTVMTPEIISKLEEVFSLGGSDLEACFYAGISKSTLYNYQKENEDFLERKEALKESTILLARQEVIKGLKNNPDLCLKYLERKCPEFSLRKKLDIENNVTLIELLDLETKKQREILNKWRNDRAKDNFNDAETSEDNGSGKGDEPISV